MTTFAKLVEALNRPEDPDLHVRADHAFQAILPVLVREHSHAQRLALASLVACWRDQLAPERRNAEMARLSYEIIRVSEHIERQRRQ